MDCQTPSKRAAVNWGIGRYLYGLPESWVTVYDLRYHDDRLNYQGANQKNGTPAFKRCPPSLPAWALPAGVTNPKPPVIAGEADQQPPAADALPPEIAVIRERAGALHKAGHNTSEQGEAIMAAVNAQVPGTVLLLQRRLEHC